MEDVKYFTKEEALEAVKDDGSALEYASEELKGDKEVVLEAVKDTGWALGYASEKLKGDKEVVLEAVKGNGRALEYASEELKGDKEVVLEAVKGSGWVLEYASEELKGDKEVVLEAVKGSGWVLEYASEELKGDKEVVLEAEKNYGAALGEASKELLNNKEFVQRALKQNPDLWNWYRFDYAKWREDKEFVAEMEEMLERKSTYRVIGMEEYGYIDDLSLSEDVEKCHTLYLKDCEEGKIKGFVICRTEGECPSGCTTAHYVHTQWKNNVNEKRLLERIDYVANDDIKVEISYDRNSIDIPFLDIYNEGDMYYPEYDYDIDYCYFHEKGENENINEYLTEDKDNILANKIEEDAKIDEATKLAKEVLSSLEKEVGQEENERGTKK